VKPLNSLRVRKAVQQVLAGGTYTEGVEEAEEAAPVTVEAS
jgi:hypothetical protein